MIKQLLFWIVILACQNINAQDYIRILGRNNYTINPDSFRLRMFFNEEEEVINQTVLINKINGANISYNIDTLAENQIVIDVNNIKDFNTIDSISYQQRKFPSISYVFNNEDFQYQDKLAINAINNATEQVQLLAKILHKDIVGIVNIDDVVEKYLFYPDYHPTSECMKKAIVLVMEYFSTPDDPGKTEYDTNIKSGQYAIWVTYKLK